MNPVRILVLILCVSFASLAWGQKPTCEHSPFWAEFHKQNMQRENRCEDVLNVHNVRNLRLKWSDKTGSWVNSSPAVANGVVYIGSFDGNLYALNASTGAKLWSYATSGYVASSPAVANGVVYFATEGHDNKLYAVNASTGAWLWSYATGGGLSSPAVANGVVYVGSNQGIVYALNARTAAKLWSYFNGYRVYSSPVVANGVIYVGSRDSHVYAFGLK